MLLDQRPQVSKRDEPHHRGNDERSRHGPGPVRTGQGRSHACATLWALNRSGRVRNRGIAPLEAACGHNGRDYSTAVNLRSSSPSDHVRIGQHRAIEDSLICCGRLQLALVTSTQLFISEPPGSPRHLQRPSCAKRRWTAKPTRLK